MTWCVPSLQVRRKTREIRVTLDGGSLLSLGGQVELRGDPEITHPFEPKESIHVPSQHNIRRFGGPGRGIWGCSGSKGVAIVKA